VNDTELDSSITPGRRARVEAMLSRRLGSVVAVAESVRRRHNASAILRTCEAFGVHEVHLVSGEFRPAKGAARGAERWLDLRLHATIDTLSRELARDGWMFRYRDDDGFGRPTVGFIICTFWLVEALAMAGRAAEARVVLDRARAAFSPLGLLSEDYEVATRRMWGNFPQAYSHVGLIHAAFSASPRWSES
jgi:hypothetical protein